MRIAVVTPQPTPYRDPFWNTVAEQPGVELDVFYCYAKGEDRPWELDWPWKFRGEVLPGWALLGDHNGYWNPGILRRLREKSYDAILLGGYNHLTMLAAACFVRRRGIPYLLMCESFERLRRPSWRRWVKVPLVRWIVGGAWGLLPTGKLARDYLLRFGGRADRYAYCPNVPDVEWFRSQSGQWEGQRNSLRRELGITDGPVVLFVGRLIWKKGVDLLLEAVARLAEKQRIWVLLLGDGPERARLQRQAGELGIAPWVKFLGFQQPRELPRFYAAGDVFVLPSRTEPWGVVVVEALASGLPVVVTELVGCYPDVVNRPEVGVVVPPDNSAALAEGIQSVLARGVNRDEIHRHWQPIFERMRYESVARDLLRLLEPLTARPGHQRVAAD
jgi:glycosyltransferase involved in cell wall biosynthesis